MSIIGAFRKRSFFTIINVMVALQLFNSSIDAADPHFGSEDLTINDIESCVELVLEVILNREDAITETEEHDASSGKPRTAVFFFAIDQGELLEEKLPEVAASHRTNLSNLPFKSLTPPILSPPPKTV
jgi:hypothetical protein